MSDNELVIQPQQSDMPARATLSASRGNASSIRRNLISAFNHIALQTRGAARTRAITIEISSETGSQLNEGTTLPDSDSLSASDLSFPDQSPIDTAAPTAPPRCARRRRRADLRGVEAGHLHAAHVPLQA